MTGCPAYLVELTCTTTFKGDGHCLIVAECPRCGRTQLIPEDAWLEAVTEDPETGDQVDSKTCSDWLGLPPMPANRPHIELDYALLALTQAARLTTALCRPPNRHELDEMFGWPWPDYPPPLTEDPTVALRFAHAVLELLLYA